MSLGAPAAAGREGTIGSVGIIGPRNWELLAICGGGRPRIALDHLGLDEGERLVAGAEGGDLDVGQDATLGDGDTRQELVQLHVVPAWTRVK